MLRERLESEIRRRGPPSFTFSLFLSLSHPHSQHLYLFAALPSLIVNCPSDIFRQEEFG